MTDQSILNLILAEGTRKFSKADPEDRTLYGQINGADDLLAYCRYIDPTFITPYHVQEIGAALSRAERGETKNLMIFVPPRFGKSYLTSQMFQSWFRGRHPNLDIMLASYNSKKASSYTGWVRDICMTDRFHSIFPDCIIDPKNREAGNFVTTLGGTTVGAGTRGGFTGWGAHLALIDDPVKDYEEARSAIIQDKIWEWYRYVLRTRLYPTAIVIIIMTRWVTDDLAGRLIEQDGLYSEGGKWDVVKLPILDAEGKSLWPDVYTENEIQSIRESVGESAFQALYMQEPIDAVDRLFSDPNFKEAPDDMKRAAYLDPAFGGSDYSAIAIGGRNDEDYYLVDGQIWRSSIDVTYAKVEKLCNAHGISKLFVESNQAQVAVAEEFRRRGISVKNISNTVNKHVRIQNSVKLNWSNTYFGKAVSNDFLKQVLQYSELVRHDDAPDALAGLITALGGGKTSILKRYSGFTNIFGRAL